MYADRPHDTEPNQYSLSIGIGVDGLLYCVTFLKDDFQLVPDYQEVTGVTPYMDQLALCNSEFVFVIRD